MPLTQANFESAHRMDVKNLKLKASLDEMATRCEQLDARQATLSNAVETVCGTPCQQIVDVHSLSMCELTWADGCGDATPPDGFSATT